MEVSVVIPTYNCEEVIGRVLEALLDQDFEGEYEIIVVDDGSTDGTKEVVEKYKEKSSKVRFMPQENSGPAAARNTGAKNAEGKYLLFTDSDCVPEPDWMSEMVSSLEREGVIGVQGRYKCLNEGSTLGKFVQYEIEERYERMEKQKYIDFIGSYSAGYSRQVFLDAGGFDEEFKEASGEDPELSYRLDKQDKKMVFNPDAVVRHEHPESLNDYLKMKFKRGYWGRLLYKKHPDKKTGQSYNSMLYFLKIPVTGVFTLSFLLGLFLNPYLSLFSLAVLFLINLPETARMAKKETKFILLAPFILYLKHIARALGILKGYLEF